MKPRRFSVGDIVRYTGELPYWSKNHDMTITEVWFYEEVKYATDKGGLFTNSELKLVKKVK